MRDRPPSHRPALIGLALAVIALVSVPPSVSAFIKCCRARALPPTLTAFYLKATSAEEGVRRAADRPTGSEPGAEHPNGALQVTGVLALVLDLDAACRAVPSGISWNPLDLAFGAPQSHPALGARSRSGTTSDGGRRALAGSHRLGA